LHQAVITAATMISASIICQCIIFEIVCKLGHRYSHIYWTDSGKDTIELANFEGNMRKTLIRDRIQEPRAIALNPLEGWMFWTDWSDEARIERAGMDGSHRSVGNENNVN